MLLAVPTRIGPFLRSSLFSWPGKLRMALDLVRPARRDPGDESIAAFLNRRFGSECVERLGEPLLAGIHAGLPERLSMRATFPRFVELEARHGSLIRGLLATRRRAPPQADAPPPAPFYSLRGGLSELVEALVAGLPTASLRRNEGAATLERDGAGYALGLAGGGRIAARALILALPPPAVAKLLTGLLPDVSAQLASVPHASTATVLLGYRREDVAHALDGHGLLVPRSEGRRTTACSFLSTKWPGRAPAGCVLLRAFVGGIRDPTALALDDAALVALVVRELGGVLGLRREPVLTRVYRWPEATPQLEVGHLDRVAGIERRLADVPGLFLTGAGLRGTGIPDCVADGTRTAQAAAAWLSA
jgi:oxygen-dependent protoporphyrinogen oxidase